MPTINIRKNYLRKLLKRRYSEEFILNRISMLGTAIEGVTRDEFIIEVFPNRPDMLSVEGFARALSLFTGARKSLPKYSVAESGLKVLVDKSVSNVRPFIRCALVKNVTLNDDSIRSIMQVQEKLHQTHGRKRRKVAIGIHDFSRMKFPLTYKAVDPDSVSFIPLGDNKEMSLSQILKRHPKGQQYSFTLEGFSKYPLLVDANGNVMSFPPIINGELTAVTEKTRDIFIDVTGSDEAAVEQALAIMVTTFADMGGKIYSVKCGVKNSPNLKWRKLPLNLAYVNKLLGLSLKKSDLKKLLLRMGIGFDGSNALIPPYRVDILHQFDLVEEVAIAYGYENFEAEIPKTATIGSESSSEIFFNHLSSIMVGFGFIETSTYHLSNYTDIKIKMNYALPYVELANSVSSEYNLLRPWLLPMLMKVLSENKTQAFPQKLFEIGTIFIPDSKEEVKVSERKSFAAVISERSADFTKIRQVLDAIMLALGLRLELEPCEHPSFISGRAASILVEGKNVGIIGEISPVVLSSWQVETPVAAFEIDATLLKTLTEKVR
ncbi:MAG: phenylalanine--tRNA ligase subunit beta [Candidatus Woesearchaeota archaeon]